MPTIAEQILALPASELAPIVSKILGGPAEIKGPWAADPISAVHNDLRTEGILKVSGSAVLDRSSTAVEWRTVLKVMRVDSSHTTNQGQPETELAFYQSGLLDKRAEGLRAIRCYGWHEREDHIIWLWLEDLSGAQHPPWTPEQHFAAARDIGRLNGRWPDGLDEDTAWLVRDPGVLRWSKQTGPPIDWPRAIASQAVRKIYPNGLLERVMALDTTKKRLQKAAQSLPRCFSHGDSHPRNLFPPDEGAGRAQTVAIDWAGVGTDVLGIDGGTSAGSSLTWGVDEAEQAVQIEAEIFAHYLTGLRDVGWDGEESTVRLGYLFAFVHYLITCAMGGVTLRLKLINEETVSRRDFIEARFGRPLQEIPAGLAVVFADGLPIVDETNKLLDDYLN